MFRIPLPTVVPPEYVLVPLSTRVPGPVFVSVPDPVPITPVTVVFPAPLNVTFCVPVTPPWLKVKSPARDLIVVADPKEISPLKVFVPETFKRAPDPGPEPFKLKVFIGEIFPCSCSCAPLVTLTLPDPRAELFCIFKIPLLTIVPPE
jgi:hypothetical protein